MRIAFIIMLMTLCTGFAGWDQHATEAPERWTVAPNKGHATRPIYYLGGAQGSPGYGSTAIRRADGEQLRADVGAACYEDTRPGHQSGNLQWRLWRRGGIKSGSAIGEVYCVRD